MQSLLFSTLILFLLSCTPNPEQVVNHTPVKIACIGNSITYGAGMADRKSNAYPIQLQRILGMITK